MHKVNCLVQGLGLVSRMKGGVRAEWIAEHKLSGLLGFGTDTSQIVDRYSHIYPLSLDLTEDCTENDNSHGS